MIAKSCFALKFELVLGKIDAELIAECDFLRELTSVIVEDTELFNQSAVKLFEYILITTKCFTKYST